MPRPNAGPRLKKGDTNYEIHWTENGRSKRGSTGTSHLPSAEKVLANFILNGEREALRVEADGAMLVSAALGDRHSGWMPGQPVPKDYWHEHVIPNAESRETAEYALDKLHKHFGHIAIADIMPDDVAAYVEARKSGKIGKPSVAATITRELSVLTAAMNHQAKAKRIARSDVPFIQSPGKSPPKDRWLSYEEADALLDAARERIDPRSPKDALPRVYRFIALALNTASRRTALLELRRDQVDLEHGMIRLNPYGRTQTNKRRAPVPISDELLPILKRTIADIERAQARLPESRRDPNPFILDHDGAIRTSFENAVERAGLGPDVTPHTLRHTKATWMAQAGVSMFDLAGVLGDSVATVTKTYAHHNPDYLRGAVNARRVAVNIGAQIGA